MPGNSLNKNNRKVERAWALYDWGNSAYFLVISTAVFPAYFIAYTPETIHFLGMDISNSSFYSYSVSFAYLIVMLLSPLLSGIADYGGKRLLMLKTFTIVGSIACIMLYFFKGEPQLWIGTSAFILATIGCAGGIVFYNAYLPEIVTKDRYDKVSAMGYAYGYIGSVLLLIMILFIVMKPEIFGISDPSLPPRIGFIMVGLWWLGFASYTFKFLPKHQIIHGTKHLFLKGIQEVSEAFGKARKDKNIVNFLLSFFFFGAGVNTVIYLASVFAENELAFATEELILIILILQLVAIGGAYLFSWVSSKSGNKISLAIQLVIWLIICIVAFFISAKIQFYFLAAIVGLVLGGIQSQARSTYSKLIEHLADHERTSFFSFYDVLFKGSIVFGTFTYGLVNQITGNMRISVLVLGLFFVLGLIFLFFVQVEEKHKPIEI
jgi:UMF1 family MFS transporter